MKKNIMKILVLAAALLLPACSRQSVNYPEIDDTILVDVDYIGIITNDNYGVAETAEKPNDLLNRIKNGDFSGLNNKASLDALEKMHKNFEALGYEWLEFDLNGDGVNELILQEHTYYEEKNRIVAIFAFNYEKHETELVYLHTIDLPRFLFLSESGNTVWYNHYSGIYDYIGYSHIVFDDEWNRIRPYTLEITHIYDFSEMPEYWFNENPDMGAVGIYFHKSIGVPGDESYVREMLSEEQFMEMFEELTGFPFNNVLPGWWDWRIDLMSSDQDNAALSWQEVYADFLRTPSSFPAYGSEFYEIFMEYPPDWFEFTFALHDFNQDGIPELLIYNIGRDMASGSGFEIYTFGGSEVVFLDFVQTERSRGQLSLSDNPSFPGLFFQYTAFDVNYVYYVELVNGQAIITDVREVFYLEHGDDEGRFMADGEIHDIRQQSSAFSVHDITEDNIQAIILHYKAGWEQALLGADFVRRHMLGNTLREYVRVIDDGKAYELFSTYAVNSDYWYDYETMLFISEVSNGSYQYIDSFEITMRLGSAIKGITLIDIDFDGIKDVLVWLGSFGNQGAMVYDAFLNRENSYIETNFAEILNPAINTQDGSIRGSTRNSGASHSFFIYSFINDSFVKTDEFTREIDLDVNKPKYRISLKDGEAVEEVYWYDEDFDLIQSVFYSANSRWGLSLDSHVEWQPIFSLSR